MFRSHCFVSDPQCEEGGYEFDSQIRMSDFRYYMTRAEERKYAVDQNKLKEYFPLETVTKGLLEIYQVCLLAPFLWSNSSFTLLITWLLAFIFPQELLSLKYEEIKGAQVWNPDVTLVRVFSFELLKSAALIGTQLINDYLLFCSTTSKIKRQMSCWVTSTWIYSPEKANTPTQPVSLSRYVLLEHPLDLIWGIYDRMFIPCCSPVVWMPLVSARWQWQLWWPTSPNPWKTNLPCSPMMK